MEVSKVINNAGADVRMATHDYEPSTKYSVTFWQRSMESAGVDGLSVRRMV